MSRTRASSRSAGSAADKPETKKPRAAEAKTSAQPASKKRRTEADAAETHGGLLPRLPTGLQLSALEFLPLYSVARMGLASREARALCEQFFAQLPEFDLSSVSRATAAVLTLVLRFSRNLRVLRGSLAHLESPRAPPHLRWDLQQSLESSFDNYGDHELHFGGTDEPIETLIERNSATLRRAPDVQLFPATLEMLSACPNLEELSPRWCKAGDDEYDDNLSDFGSADDLDSDGSDGSGTDAGYGLFVGAKERRTDRTKQCRHSARGRCLMEIVQRCTQLRSMGLLFGAIMGDLTGAMATELLSVRPLRELRLVKCSEPHIRAAAAAGTRIEELEVLEIKADFAYGGPCGDDAISALLRHCGRSLQSLTILSAGQPRAPRTGNDLEWRLPTLTRLDLHWELRKCVPSLRVL